MEYYTGKGRDGQDKQGKTCCKTQHVKIDIERDAPMIICRIAAVGENYNSTRDILALLVCCIGSGCNNKIEGEPDLLSSFSMNRDENLVVIANWDKIEDKDEFARLLVRMCKENSFHSIKFSTARGYATSLDMRVYLWRDEFSLYVDGELIENQ